MRKAFILLGMLTLLNLWNLSITAEGEELKESKLYATYCSVIDSETGRVLYEKNGSTQVPMASTTKILTCIVILEQGNLQDFALTSKYASSMPKVHMGAKEGEYYKVQDLLYALMLESYNDAGVILAEYLCGNVESFADVLNEKAKEIGCEDYHFVTPNGLDGTDEEGEHSISATDLAKIMAYCTLFSPEKEEFINITTTSSYTVSAYKKDGEDYVKSGREKSCVNRNSLLSNPNVISGKTGFTNKAGYCYVCQTVLNNRKVSFSLLACGWPNNKTYKWKDSATIMDYIQDNFREETVEYPKILTETYPLVKNSKKSIGGSLTEKVEVTMAETDGVYFISQEDEVNYIYNILEEIEAPVQEGTIVGEVQVYINEVLVDVISVYTREEVERNSFRSCMEEVFNYFIVKVINIDFFKLK